jgi:predicted nucleic acid-binding protein
VILVDTNVISEPTRKRPSPSVLTFLLQNPVVALSSISVLELEAGIQAASAAKRGSLALWMEALLASGAVQVIPVDTTIAREAGRLRVETKRHPVALEDLLIGATARARGMTLATRNVAHFERVGVTVVNPFR